jgi:peptidoglycan/xylan/chitin deacetylase (PgdA/CDA1 family)
MNTDIGQIDAQTGRSPAIRRQIILCCDCEGTERQLERLWKSIESVGIAANFFFVGDTARAFPVLVREIASRHQCESHTLTHANLRKLSRDGQRREIVGGRNAVEDIIGRPTRGFRAPFHAFNRDTVEILDAEGFVFDASTLYYRYPMGNLRVLKPTWFREWMPLYSHIGLSPHAALGIFRTLVRIFPVSVLPAHPHYAGADERMASAFRDFLSWAVDEGAVFWPIDKWLLQRESVPHPEWVSPLGPKLCAG